MRIRIALPSLACALAGLLLTLDAQAPQAPKKAADPRDVLTFVFGGGPDGLPGSWAWDGKLTTSYSTDDARGRELSFQTGPKQVAMVSALMQAGPPTAEKMLEASREVGTWVRAFNGGKQMSSKAVTAQFGEPDRVERDREFAKVLLYGVVNLGVNEQGNISMVRVDNPEFRRRMDEAFPVPKKAEKLTPEKLAASAEEKAAGLLAKAEASAAKNQKLTARLFAEQVLQQYPKTEAAKKAKTFLSKLPK